MEEVTLDKKQQKRVEVITRVQSGRWTREEAAGALGVTRRQMGNVLRRFEEDGLSSVVHANTGREPVFKTPEDVAKKVLEFAGEGGKYHDFTVCHFHQMLEEHEGIAIGRSTLDRLLRKGGVRLSRAGRRGVYRKRRTRSSAEGHLVQIDGSLHDWLEGRGPRMALIGAIDDATGKILYLEFWLTECQPGYLRLFRVIAVNHGLPQAYYHDRHTMLQSPKERTVQDELDGKEPMSELQRVLTALGVESISAHSPQAKGRIERLWGTLQQRLVKEMRLAGVDSLEAANAFLPGFIERYNAHFAKEPADTQNAWVAIEPDMDLDYYFSVQETRTVGNDHVVRWHNRLFLILHDAGQPSLARRQVTVHLTPEETVHLYNGRQRLRHQELEQRPAPATAQAEPQRPTKQPDAEAERRRLGWLFAGTSGGAASKSKPITSP